MPTYKKTSPYASTPVHGSFLDVLEHRKITKKADDVTYKINSVYKYRPDMLAYDLYGDSNLWWVFSLRNPNVLLILRVRGHLISRRRPDSVMPSGLPPRNL